MKFIYKFNETSLNFVVLFSNLALVPALFMPRSQTFSCTFSFLEKFLGPGHSACSVKWINWICLSLPMDQ